MDLASLDQSVLSLLTQGLASSTLATYRSGIRRYTAFCRQFGLTPLPLCDLNLCRFVSYLHYQHLSPASVHLYLASLRYLQIVAGGRDPHPGEFPRLQYAVRAVRRLNPSRSRPLRLPITPAILRSLHRAWSSPPVAYRNRLLWAACCLGFFAFLRSGEFTCPSAAAYVPSMLSWGDIQVDSHDHPSYLRIVLRQSKTDLFGAGVSLFVGATGDTLCPVAAVLSYLSVRPSRPGPLFTYQDGRPLSRADLVAAVRQALAAEGFDVSRFNGHSFRIGAATTAAQVGVPDSVIQTLGRWKSSAFMTYVQTSPQQLTAISRHLVSS